MYDPNDYRAQSRYERAAGRAQRRYYRYQNPMRGLGSAIFIIALIIAFSWPGGFHGPSFLVWLFAGLAFFTLFGSVSSMNRNAIYGGLYGFVWLLGLALCFLIGFWPWILLPVVVSMLLGSLFRPLMAGIQGTGFLASQQPPYQQTSPQPEQPDYQPYQQGYQAQSAYQENSQQEPYSQIPKQEYEQPQMQYPEQELPPMEQH